MDISEKPFVSVVVPVKNGANSIDALLKALLNQDYPKDKTQIILVDNGSLDGTYDLIKKYPVVYAQEDRVPGSYAARNKGLSLAAGDIIAFTDADCCPEPDWISKGVEALMSEGAALAGGRVSFILPENPSTSELIDSTVYMQNEVNVKTRKSAVTANLFVRKELFEKMGCFESARSGSDFLWTRKATRLGYPLIYVPDAVVHHPTRRFRALMRKSYRVGSGFLNLVPRRFYAMRVLWLIVRLMTPVPSKVIVKVARGSRNKPETKRSYFSFWGVSYAYQLVQAAAVIRAISKKLG
jgi:glycosyltransferase involved in cell wall biosynthesis